MATQSHVIKLKRAYAAPTRGDGCRILVDRMWPRGVSKHDLKIDEWSRDIAPSTRLRKWFAHDPAKWQEFKERYFAELDSHPETVEHLLQSCRRHTLTLVCGAKDIQHNNAVALREYLQRHSDS